ncbi:hypothetical protein Tco_0743047 [Tanacetum coccineum]
MGSLMVTAGMEEFRDCLCKIEAKLDSVMGNVHFLEKFPNANALFLPFVTSDHTLYVLNIPSISGAKPKPFKFANFLASKPEFLPAVKSSWCKNIQGCSMFSVVSKLKLLKKPLRKLKYAQGDLAGKVKSLKKELCNVQADMVKDPTNVDIRQKEAYVLNKFKETVRDEELFLKQRSKVHWLSEGDHNTKYFHRAMKEKRNSNRIEFVEDLDGNFYSGEDVGEQFIKYFEGVLGRRVVVDPVIDPSSLFSNKLYQRDTEFMVRPVSHEEIKAALFSMEDDKAPGPDGFSSKFFKASWSVVGPEFTKAIQDYFSHGKLLKEINATSIALVPKIKTPKKSLIFGLYLVAMKNSPFNVAFKIDINRAYDSVDWGFLSNALSILDFLGR